MSHLAFVLKSENVKLKAPDLVATSQIPSLLIEGHLKKHQPFTSGGMFLVTFIIFSKKGRESFGNRAQHAHHLNPPSSMCVHAPPFKSVVIPGGGSYVFTVFLATFLGSGLSWLSFQSEGDGPKSPS